MAAGELKRTRSLFGALPSARTSTASEPSLTATVRRPKTYHSVSIAPGHHACAQVKLLKDRRFLSHEAPSLPLRTCCSMQCECTYLHHEDRRVQKRRARDLGVTLDAFEDDDRRGTKERGRRTSDR